MTEKNIVVSGLTVSYEGLFNVLELYKIFDDWQKKNNYDKTERESIEYVKPEGKYIELRMEPARKESDYVRFELRVHIVMENIKETVVDIDGEKKKMNEGKVTIAFDAWLETDYEEAWSTRPNLYFLRLLIDKYIYKIYSDKFSGQLRGEVNELATHVKSFLNLYKY